MPSQEFVRTLECIIKLNPDPNPPRIGQRLRVFLKAPPKDREHK